MTVLLDHLYIDYKDIKDFRELSSTVTENRNRIALNWLQIEDDQFIMSSSESAIYRREKEFNILPDRTKETLDFRKRRLLVKMQSNPPYVLAYLENVLTGLLGENKHSIHLDILLFELEVLIEVESSLFHAEVKRILERIVPLNVKLSTALLLTKERIVLQHRSYSFDVPFPITNMFQTANISGGVAKLPFTLIGRAYNFAIRYPITNVMYPVGEGLRIDGDVGLTMHTTVYKTDYSYIGEFITGEEDL